MMGDEVVDATLFGVQAAAQTYVHRISHFEALNVESIAQYFEVLKEGSVDLYPQSRRTSILEAFAKLEKEHGVVIEVDEDLLDEVVAITEHPTPLLGHFDESFLELPPEVIITSMKEHQRYFPVFKDNKLINAFVVVSNALCDDFTQVIEGNERVLRPRLSDALFFYHNDLKKGLSTAGLEKVVFMNGLGTLLDKIEREKRVASALFDLVDERMMCDKGVLTWAIELAKADLMSEMVYEFTELQGLMGYYYATALGEGSEIALAIKEQYLPTGEESALPSNILSAVVAMAIKLDTLIGMFSIGEIPTGSRDPFALRRAVNGIIKIALAHSIPLNFSTFIARVSEHYPKGNEYQAKIETFIIERLAGVYPDVNSSIIQAVVKRDIGVFLDIEAFDIKIRRVDEMAKASDAKESFSLIKRLANILKDEEINESPVTDNFNDYERALYDKFSQIIDKFGENLEMLFEIRKPLDDFFANVMVNDDNLEIRANRKKLLNMIYKEFDKFADFKQITL
jgi:glycyl-tRNA synthetase beta chain